MHTFNAILNKVNLMIHNYFRKTIHDLTTIPRFSTYTGLHSTADTLTQKCKKKNFLLSWGKGALMGRESSPPLWGHLR